VSFYLKNQIKQITKEFLMAKFNSGCDKRGIIFWGHLGLGDQISAARAIEMFLDKGFVVVIPTKSNNLDFISSTYGTWNRVIVAEISSNAENEVDEILRLKREYNFRIVVAGHSFLKLLERSRDDVCLNEKLNFCAGLELGQLVSAKMRESLSRLDQFPVPQKPYAFIDHHPGTDREIPPKILDGLKSRGLVLITNPRQVPLSSLLNLLDNADELHFVASAPLCLALTLNAKPKLKYYYRTNGQGSLKSISYKDWLEVDLRLEDLGDNPRLHFSRALRLCRYLLNGSTLNINPGGSGRSLYFVEPKPF
jgi:hypothetical protein